MIAGALKTMDAVLSLPVLIGLIAVALAFDFLNGLHDAANSIATIVSTRVLRPQYAVAWAAFFNFIAFLFFGLHVAETLGTGIIAAAVVDPRVVFGALMGAILWNLITWGLGIPSSSSHALIGGLVGAGIAKAGVSAIVWKGLLPTTAAIVAVAADRLPARLDAGAGCCRGFSMRRTPFAVDRIFRHLQFVSASLYSLGHGGNDAQKTMGIIAVLLYSQGHLGSEFHVPFWVVITCQIGDGARHADRRLAHRQDHGLEDHPADADAGLLRGDRRLDHAVCRDLARHSGVDHPHHHRLDHRRRRRAQDVGGALERRQQYRRSPGSSRSRRPAAIAALFYWLSAVCVRLIHAATRARKPSTSWRSSAAAASTACEAVSTLSADWRVSVAAPVTSPSTDTTSLAPSAALATFCEISAGRRALLLDRGRDGGGATVDFLHAARDAADRRHRAAGRRLHRRDQLGNILGRLGGLHRQRFDLRRHHREALAGFAGARGLDRGVERQQVGLPGDGADQLDDVADLLRGLRQRGDLLVGALRLARPPRARCRWSG